MSRIHDLIRELCPDGVAAVQLGEVCRVKTGQNINKTLINSNPGEFPVINSGKEPLGFFNSFNVIDDPIGIASRGSVGLVTWTPGRFFRGNLNYGCTVKDPKVLSARFLYHLLLESDSEIQALSTHQGIPALNASALKSLRIALPPIDVQREIVSILDKFTQLEAELEAELETRRTQYEVTRDRLLDFSGDLSAHPMGEMIRELCPEGVTYRRLSEISTGAERLIWAKLSDLELQYIGLSSVDRETHKITETTPISRGNAPSRAQQVVEAGDVIFATTRPVQMRWAIISADFEGQIASTGYCVLRPHTGLVLTNFLAYAIAGNAFRHYVETNQVRGNYPSIRDKVLREFSIPLPPLEVQREVVSILDKLDALVNDITYGLPAEIEARRKQYEYYRNKLLIFKELDAA